MPDWKFRVGFPKAYRLPTHRKDRNSKSFSLVTVFLPQGCFGKDKVTTNQFRALSDKTVFSISLQRHRMTREGRGRVAIFCQ